MLDPRAAQPGELERTPYDLDHLCHPGDTSKFQALRALRWELHAPAGNSEQRAPTSWLNSARRRHCHLPSTPKGVRGDCIVPGVRDDKLQEVPQPPASTYCVSTYAKKLSDSLTEKENPHHQGGRQRSTSHSERLMQGALGQRNQHNEVHLRANLERTREMLNYATSNRPRRLQQNVQKGTRTTIKGRPHFRPCWMWRARTHMPGLVKNTWCFKCLAQRITMATPGQNHLNKTPRSRTYTLNRRNQRGDGCSIFRLLLETPVLFRWCGSSLTQDCREQTRGEPRSNSTQPTLLTVEFENTDVRTRNPRTLRARRSMSTLGQTPPQQDAKGQNRPNVTAPREKPTG